MSPDPETPDVPPITDLGSHTVDVDPDLRGRVHRSINRRVLAADTVDFSLKVLALTAWDYLKAVFDLLPAEKPDKKETPDG